MSIQARTISRYSQASNRSASRNVGRFPPGPDECLLGGILREFGVPQTEHRDRVQPIDGAARQRGEGVAVSVSRPVDELPLHALLPSEATDLVAYTLRRVAGPCDT